MNRRDVSALAHAAVTAGLAGDDRAVAVALEKAGAGAPELAAAAIREANRRPGDRLLADWLLAAAEFRDERRRAAQAKADRLLAELVQDVAEAVALAQAARRGRRRARAARADHGDERNLT